MHGMYTAVSSIATQQTTLNKKSYDLKQLNFNNNYMIENMDMALTGLRAGLQSLYFPA